MKLTNITKLIGIGVIALVMTGCGGGGSSSTGGGNNTGSTQPPVASSPFDNIQTSIDGSVIKAGTYSGTGTYYFDLNLPNSGNVIAKILGAHANVKLYDNALNLLDDSFSYPDTKYVNAGNYILGVDFGTGSGAEKGFTFSLNSNALFNQNNLPALQNKQYEAPVNNRGFVKYYKLVMQNGGNLIVDGKGSHFYAKFYDTNLNLLDDSLTLSSPKHLEAGTYVIGIRFDTYPVSFKF